MNIHRYVGVKTAKQLIYTATVVEVSVRKKYRSKGQTVVCKVFDYVLASERRIDNNGIYSLGHHYAVGGHYALRNNFYFNHEYDTR